MNAGNVSARIRSCPQKIIDFITFPFRALFVPENDFLGLSSLRTERFDYVAREVMGYCLDVGCGKQNLFIDRHLCRNGKGIDVFRYEGLRDEHICEDLTHFPFEDETFSSVSFIANINHVPRSKRDIELAEAYRCLKTHGNIIVTMGHPLAEILIHKLLWFYDTFFFTHVDMDNERGMHEEEEYFLKDQEIVERLQRAGFKNITKKYFLTQWRLNALTIGWK